MTCPHFKVLQTLWQFGTCLKFWAPPSPLPTQFHCCISGKPCCKRWARWARSWFQRPASTSICTSTRHNGLWVNDFASQRVLVLDFDLVRCSSLSEDFSGQTTSIPTRCWLFATCSCDGFNFVCFCLPPLASCHPPWASSQYWGQKGSTIYKLCRLVPERASPRKKDPKDMLVLTRDKRCSRTKMCTTVIPKSALIPKGTPVPKYMFGPTGMLRAKGAPTSQTMLLPKGTFSAKKVLITKRSKEYVHHTTTDASRKKCVGPKREDWSKKYACVSRHVLLTHCKTWWKLKRWTHSSLVVHYKLI